MVGSAGQADPRPSPDRLIATSGAVPPPIELQAAGRSLRQTAANINDQGHKTRRERY